MENALLYDPSLVAMMNHCSERDSRSSTMPDDHHCTLALPTLSPLQLDKQGGDSEAPFPHLNSLATPCSPLNPSSLIDVEVALGASSRDILLRDKIGIVQSIDPESIAKVYVSHLGQEIRIPAHCLQPVVPRIHDNVKVLNGGSVQSLAGAIGKVVSIALGCAVVKVESSEFPDLIQLSLNSLGKYNPTCSASYCQESQVSSTASAQLSQQQIDNPFLNTSYTKKAQSYGAYNQGQVGSHSAGLTATSSRQLTTPITETTLARGSQSDNTGAVAMSYSPYSLTSYPLDFSLSSSTYCPTYSPSLSSCGQHSSIYSPAVASRFISRFPSNQELFSYPFPQYSQQSLPNDPFGYLSLTSLSSHRHSGGQKLVDSFSGVGACTRHSSDGLNRGVDDQQSGRFMDLQTVAIKRSEQTSVDQLLKEVLRKQQEYKFLRSQGENSDVKSGPVGASLICPLSQQRMKYPSRGIFCKHLQCFDAEVYLKFNRALRNSLRKANKSRNHSSDNNWRCPVCQRFVHYKHLIIDKNLLKVVSDTDLTEVEFDSNGVWKAIAKTPCKVDVIDLTGD